MSFNKRLEDATKAAKIAARYALGERRKDTVSLIGKDIKLEADYSVERLIINFLKERYDYAIISEESYSPSDIELEEFYWIIDPIDGSMNLYKGIPFSCISIALWSRNQPILGVIYDFIREDTYMGIIGEGAWLNDQNIQVSNVTTKQSAVLASGFPVGRRYDSKSLYTFLGQIQEFKKIRMFGSAAMSLAYLACGKVDAYYEEDIMIWDIAAGAAIVKAAGGYINLDQSSLQYQMKVMCAASETLFIRG